MTRRALGILTLLFLSSGAVFCQTSLMEKPQWIHSLSTPTVLAYGGGSLNLSYHKAFELQQGDYIPWEANTHFGLAMFELAALEFIPFSLNHYIRKQDWANITWQSAWDNLQAGWEYDTDDFTANQFGHPYHGGLFFNAGRTNGYDFWESMAFSIGGSVAWEHFAETFRPSINDLINTGVGGATFGEALYQLSELITDNTATGSTRVWEEIAGTLVDPPRGFTRLLSGETGHVFPNPEERTPEQFHPVITTGLRLLDADGTSISKDLRKQFIIGLDAVHADPFTDDISKPFSWFSFGVGLAIPSLDEDSISSLARIHADGSLIGWKLTREEEEAQVLSLHLIYDYVNNPAFAFGQVSLGTDLDAYQQLSHSFSLGYDVELRGIMMGQTPNDYYHGDEGRKQDIGQGVGADFDISLKSQGWKVLRVYYSTNWFWTTSPPEGSNHHVHLVSFEARYPFSRQIAIGADIASYNRVSEYDYAQNVTSVHPIARFVLSYIPL